MNKGSTVATGQLSERSQHLFKLLVERYIRDGQPVGSRTLARDSAMDLSPATIRNVMADLEDLGLIASPHTSAGRVPTVQGYRLFVDSLLTVKPMQEDDVIRLQRRFADAADPQQVLVAASSLLSDISSMAGVIMVPRREQPRVHQVEFLSLAENKVLVILVVNEREVQNRVIQTTRRYTAGELQQAANYLNQLLAGRDFLKVRETLLSELRETQQNINQLMLAAVELADRSFQGTDEGGDYVIAGQTNLMAYAEMADVERLRKLFDAFNRKRDILHLLDQSLTAQGVQIFIGEESGYQVLDSCSVVISPYDVDGRIVGVLGVIGPTRMAYDRLIPLVDVTARLLGAALNQT